MTAWTDLGLLGVIVTDLFVLSTTRIGACIRALTIQGILLAVLPPLLHGGPGTSGQLVITALVTLLIKAVVIPRLLSRAMRDAEVRREAQPFVSMHLSGLLGVSLVAFAFWVGRALRLPIAVASDLILPVSLATFFVGFLVLVSRRKAITQVVGFLMLENGVFLFGLCLTRALPFVVELAVLLDVLVGVFVMGIMIHHIRQEFDHLDTFELASLKE
ncbi:MAG: hydrogenase [Candidatus Eisenbacteria bacterium]|nr:hydrogenase [Candidatus Eisenbacteria bacterium]